MCNHIEGKIDKRLLNLLDPPIVFKVIWYRCLYVNTIFLSFASLNFLSSHFTTSFIAFLHALEYVSKSTRSVENKSRVIHTCHIINEQARLDIISIDKRFNAKRNSRLDVNF